MGKRFKDIKSMAPQEMLIELNRYHNIGDAAYRVRDRAAEGAWGKHDGSAWLHPVVKRYGELATALMAWAKEDDDGTR